MGLLIIFGVGKFPTDSNQFAILHVGERVSKTQTTGEQKMRHLNSLMIALVAVPMLFASLNAQELTAPVAGKVFVSLDRNNDLTGAILDLEALKVETAFGAVSIPMSKIDGVKMHADAKDNAVIAFKNGDLVTGKVILDIVKLKTEWGTAHINTDKVETITNSKGAKFFSDTSTGKAVWRFSKASGRNTN